MKKYFLIFAILIANQSFADISATNGVANSATCDSGALDTDSGGAALEAQYTPETINLRWYDNNTLMNVTSTSSDACTYDAGISLPTNPTKTGFTFKGWKVRPEYDFTNFQVTNMLGRWTKDGNICRNTSREIVDCDSNFADLNNGEWKEQFPWGTIYGSALCSSTPGTERGETGNPSTNSGVYCWCMATGYIPNDSTIKYKPTNNIWVFHSTRPSYDECISSAGMKCLYDNRDFRKAMFGIKY